MPTFAAPPEPVRGSLRADIERRSREHERMQSATELRIGTIISRPAARSVKRGCQPGPGLPHLATSRSRGGSPLVVDDALADVAADAVVGEQLEADLLGL